MKRALLLFAFLLTAASGFAQADLMVTVTDNKTIYVPGTDVIYTITVLNYGSANSNGVRVTAAMPVGITTGFFWEGSNNSAGAGAVNDLNRKLAPGEFVTYTVTVEIPATFTGDLVFKASALSEGMPALPGPPVVPALTPSADPNPSSNTDITDTDIPANADIGIVNTDFTNVYTPGQASVYLVKVTNNGPTDALNVSIKNTVPSNINPASFSWTGSNGTSGTGIGLSDFVELFHVGEVITYTVTINVPLDFGGYLTSNAFLFATSPDPTPADQTSADTDVLTFGADVVVAVTDNNNSYIPGQGKSYTLTVTNMGENAATQIHVTAPLPAGIAAMSWTGNSTNGNGSINNTIANLAAGASVTYTINFNVPLDFIGNLVVSGNAIGAESDPNPDCMLCTDTDYPGADLVVVNTNNQTKYTPGQTTTYTVTVTNNGPNNAENVVLTNAIPNGVSTFSWYGSNGSNGAGAALQDTLPILAVGETVTYTITLVVPTGFTGPLTNATYTTSDTEDPVPGCTQCTDTDAQQVSEIQITNTNGEIDYVVGTIHTKTYTVTVTNNGPDAAVNVFVNNPIPSGATQFSWTGTNGSGNNFALNNTIPSLASGASVTYTITLQMPATITGNFISSASVQILGYTLDTNTANNTAIDTDVPVVPNAANLVVTNTNGQDVYTAGSNTTYTVTVTNNGPAIATNITFTNPAPSGTTISAWSGNATSGSGDLSNTIASLAVGASMAYTITVQIPAGYTSNLVDQANATSAVPDPDPSCPSCTDTDVSASPQADVSVTITDNKTNYDLGGVSVYTVTVHNNGPQTATGVHVQAAIPSGITSFSWAGNAANGTTALDNTITSLINGATVTYTITITVPATYSASASVALQAGITASTSTDPAAANNSATDTDLPKQTDISITNVANQPTPPKGGTVTFTVTVTNNGPNNATSINFTNPLPVGITGMTWSANNGTSGSGAINATIPVLALGASIVYTITVTIPANYTGTLSSIATVNAAIDSTQPTTATATVTPANAADIGVTITDGTTTFLPGQTKFYTITVYNNGSATATNVALNTILPAGIPAANYTWSGNSSSGTNAFTNVIATIPAGGSVTYSVSIVVPNTYDINENLVHIVAINSTATDPTPNDHSAQDVDTPNVFADLVVKKSDNKATYEQSRYVDDKPNDAVQPVLVNEYVTYSIIVTNYGPATANNIEVYDPIPVNSNATNSQIQLSDVEWISNSGVSGTGDLYDVIPSLAVGESVSYTVTVHVPQNYNIGATVGNLTNNVTVTSDTADPQLSNNFSSDVDVPSAKFLLINNDPLLYASNYTDATLAQGFVEDVLVRSHCANVSNFVMSSGPNHVQKYGVAYFNRNGSDFPIEDGIVLTSGDVTQTSGPNDPGVNSNSDDWTGDSDLSSPALVPSVGASNAELHNPVSLKFNFIPTAPELSFNFIFAADEYSIVSSYECTYSDVFAFILKDLTAGGPAKNLAVLPGVIPATPVKVTSIHETVAGCPAINTPFFGKHNFSLTDATVGQNAAIDVNGQTKLLQAKGTVIPGHEYSIKLVIANKSDGALNSSVFIEGGSFKFNNEIEGPGNVNSFPVGKEQCYGEPLHLTYGDAPLVGATYYWKRNDIRIPGESSYDITVTEGGIYTVVAEFSANCRVSDDITVTFKDRLPLSDPKPLRKCVEGGPYVFDLDQTAYMLNGGSAANYDIHYYENEQDAKDYASNDIETAGNLHNFIVTADIATTPKTIYVRIDDLGPYGCVEIRPFTLSAYESEGTIAYPAGPYCINGGILQAQPSANLTSGGQYIATPAGLNINPLTGAIDLDASVLGTYNVVYKIPADDCPEFDSNIVQILVEPCISCTVDATGPASVCLGNTINLTALSNNATATYSWVGTDGFVSSQQNPTVTPLPTAGTYTYTVTSTVMGIDCATDTVTVVVVDTPTAAFVSNSATICTNSSTNIVFEGTPGASVVYTINNGSPITSAPISTPPSGLGTVSIPTGNLSAATTYTLVSVTTNTTPACTYAFTPAPAITIAVGLPDATVVAVNPVVCAQTCADFTITGTPGATVAYTDGTTPASVTLDAASGTATVSYCSLTTNKTITLTNIISNSTPSCSKALTVSATVTVNPLPSVTTFTAISPICEGTTGILTFVGTPNASVTYTDQNNAVYPAVPLNATGNATVTTAALSTAMTYTLINITSSGSVPCTATLTQQAIINIDLLPVITAQPVDSTVCNGQSVTFTVAATGTNIHYQWKFGTTNVGTDQNSYTIAVPTNADAGNYTVTVSNNCSSVTSNIAVLSVNQPTVITSQPADLTICEGQAISLSVIATGVTLSYQWFKGTTPLVGETNASLNIASAILADASAYHIDVINPCQTVSSAVANVVVNQLPAIVTQPVGSTICSGQPFTLSVVATGTNLTYQWYQGPNLILGANTDTYTVNSSLVSDTGDYTVVVSGVCTPSVASAIAAMTVNQGPAIVTQPMGVVTCEGQPINLSVTATGTNLNYQWLYNGGIIPGATAATFSIPVAALGDAGNYTVEIATSSCPTILSSVAVVVVNQLPAIITGPVAVTVCEGATVTLTVDAIGTGLNYQWKKGTTNVGTDSATFTIASSLPSDSGLYSVVVSGVCAPAVTSVPVQVTVDATPVITTQPVDITRCAGETISVSVTATGSNLTYQWLKGIVPISGATSSTFTIASTVVEDSGTYTCIVSNSNATCPAVTSGPAEVVINVAPGIATQPVSRIVCLGETVNFTVLATGNNLEYQWLYNNQPITVDGTSNSYIIPVAQLSNSGNYTVRVSSPSCPSVTSSVAYLIVNPLPQATIANGLEPIICGGNAADVIISGTPNAVVTYTINGGEEQTVILSPSGSAILSTGNLEESVTYQLNSVASNDTPICTKSLLNEPGNVAVVTVNVLPDTQLDQDGFICIDAVTGSTLPDSHYLLDTGLDIATFSFEWYLDDVLISVANPPYNNAVDQPFYDAVLAGAYEVIATDRNSGCTRTATATITTSSPPVSITADVVTEWFAENATIVVTVTPPGLYEYRLDDGPYQESNTFEGVRTLINFDQTGAHKVYARDLKACDEISYNVDIIDYPKYFTPNGDGFHDYWNISTLSGYPNAKIYIFDRFGKLLKQISTTSLGWDGTFNGKPMLADDYWFVVKYTEGGINKEFKAHFSLKR
ncbi:MAG: choice-of-anchor L domain-containing protein [Flavobacterium sp.]|nr:choice-of-anchor L domain-containing protein [Flavobacterium sp.]